MSGTSGSAGADSGSLADAVDVPSDRAASDFAGVKSLGNTDALAPPSTPDRERIIYHALWLSALTPTADGVAILYTLAPPSSPSVALAPAIKLRVAAQLDLAHGREALSTTAATFALAGQVDLGLRVQMPLQSGSCVHVRPTTEAGKSWVCAADLQFSPQAGQVWRLTLQTSAVPPLRRLRATGEPVLATLYAGVGADAPVLGHGEVAMSLRYFLHQMTGVALP